ncbi:MAG: SpoIIE family protein phosphatase [Candidatus Eisenbacteria bacterium]|uniref:SpoIIE family protein phosphatase n=1 Tax=Eiseniibacteriota bacterium TaxID=2212470 RepID=A0A9D6LAB7_UNCEI|nr:SpoIIE family protein phosphatase [Candidatus Eisenbacteria bacterium]
MQKTTGLLSADEGSIKLLGVDGGATAKTLVRKHQPGLDSGSWELPIVTTVMGYLLHKGEPLISSDLLDDERFSGIRRIVSRVRAVMAVPLKVDNRITGMLAVTNRTPGRHWTDDEAKLLTIVATNSAGVIEQARLRVEAEEKKRLEEENRRMESELDLARDIQMSLVPSGPLHGGPWEVHGKVVPARQVGGDYFDYFPLDGSRFAITIADVSGKGVPAALLMSNVQASLRAFCNGEREITEAIRQVNRSVARSASGGKFITLFYARCCGAATARSRSCRKAGCCSDSSTTPSTRMARRPSATVTRCCSTATASPRRPTATASSSAKIVCARSGSRAARCRRRRSSAAC